MRPIFANIVRKLQKFLGRFGIRVERISTIDNLRYRSWKLDSIQIWSKSTAPPDLKKFIFDNLHLSNAQLQQDLIALWLNSKCRAKSTSKFYVEFGACDGVEYSNSLQLEKSGWDGILAEPARNYRKALILNRKAHLDFRAVAEKSGEFLKFVEAGVLSSLERYSWGDIHTNDRHSNSRVYLVETVTLDQLLLDYDAPHNINFLSIDTEGSESSILSKFKFGDWDIDFICVEHNHSSQHQEILEIFERNGYKNVLPEVSDFDLWFIPNHYNNLFNIWSEK